MKKIEVFFWCADDNDNNKDVHSIQDLLVSRIVLWTYCSCNDCEEIWKIMEIYSPHWQYDQGQSQKMQTINYPKLDNLIELIRDNCIKIKPEHCNSIDEKIISAKTKDSGGVTK